MSALTDILLQNTDPMTGLLLMGLYVYLGRLSRRISRLEDVYIPDSPPHESLTDQLRRRREGGD